MAIDLLDVLKTHLWRRFYDPLSCFLGESESGIKSIVSSSCYRRCWPGSPKGTATDGASHLLSVVNNPQVDASLPGNIDQIFSGAAPASIAWLARVPTFSVRSSGRRCFTSAFSSISGISGTSACKLLGLPRSSQAKTRERAGSEARPGLGY